MTRGLKRKGGGQVSLGETVDRVASFPAPRTLINRDVGSQTTPPFVFFQLIRVFSVSVRIQEEGKDRLVSKHSYFNS